MSRSVLGEFHTVPAELRPEDPALVHVVGDGVVLLEVHPAGDRGAANGGGRELRAVARGCEESLPR